MHSKSHVCYHVKKSHVIAAFQWVLDARLCIIVQLPTDLGTLYFLLNAVLDEETLKDMKIEMK